MLNQISEQSALDAANALEQSMRYIRTAMDLLSGDGLEDQSMALDAIAEKTEELIGWLGTIAE